VLGAVNIAIDSSFVAATWWALKVDDVASSGMRPIEQRPPEETGTEGPVSF